MTPEQNLRVKSLQTRSEIFNYVVEHLRRQGKQSVLSDNGWLVPGASTCAYRGAGETMCAVGALIADDEYDPSWECCPVEFLFDEDVPASLRERLAPHEEMLTDLQHFHDTHLKRETAFEGGRFSEKTEGILRGLREKWDIH